MTTANRRNITNVYRIKRIKPTKTSYAGQTNGQRTTHGQKFKSGNRADAIAKTYQINYEKNPMWNLPPHVKEDGDLRFRFFRCDDGWTDQKNLHTTVPLRVPVRGCSVLKHIKEGRKEDLSCYRNSGGAAD